MPSVLGILGQYLLDKRRRARWFPSQQLFKQRVDMSTLTLRQPYCQVSLPFPKTPFTSRSRRRLTKISITPNLRELLRFPGGHIPLLPRLKITHNLEIDRLAAGFGDESGGLSEGERLLGCQQREILLAVGLGEGIGEDELRGAFAELFARGPGDRTVVGEL